MIFTILSIAVTVLCLSGIIAIIVKRWNALGAIDLESLPAERDARMKKKIISERMRRQYHQMKAKISTKAEPLASLAAERTERLRAAVANFFDTLYKKRESARGEDGDTEFSERGQARIEKDIASANKFFDEERYDEAEKQYIEIIAKDAKNLEAYEGLAQLYVRKKEWASSQEVFEFLCTQLRECAKRGADAPAERSNCEMRLAESLKELSEVYVFLEKHAEAERCTQEALELQPQNPKFLDAAIEMYMMSGKKREARAVLSRLRAANPDNQKLAELGERIDNL